MENIELVETGAITIALRSDSSSVQAFLGNRPHQGPFGTWSAADQRLRTEAAATLDHAMDEPTAWQAAHASGWWQRRLASELLDHSSNVARGLVGVSLRRRAALSSNLLEKETIGRREFREVVTKLVPERAHRLEVNMNLLYHFAGAAATGTNPVLAPAEYNSLKARIKPRGTRRARAGSHSGRLEAFRVTLELLGINEAELSSITGREVVSIRQSSEWRAFRDSWHVSLGSLFEGAEAWQEVAKSSTSHLVAARLGGELDRMERGRMRERQADWIEALASPVAGWMLGAPLRSLSDLLAVPPVRRALESRASKLLVRNLMLAWRSSIQGTLDEVRLRQPR